MEEIIELRRELFSIVYSNWKENTLFTPQWWILLIIVIGLWFIWWKLVDKSRLMEVCFLGTVVGIVSTLLNSIGIELVLWGFPNQLFSLVKTFNLLDLTFIPITYMLLYQYFTRWLPYSIAVIIFGLLGSFIGQPLFTMLGIYETINWEYVYSFPVYLLIGFVGKLVVSFAKKHQTR
ncbi:CBO0543 family protein [Mangrovibacillus cuniculi]|uniref:Uncharacterized protein n=1 Tax=Mangrovibacillus cuniculi TaxID=2593652 RepID=A0A7S8C8Z2_9BACI|nr:CBO0543 family protein [Mangrovibacillus cuniculi]QPC45602.1 hypothetical protein G8O30_00725 [Mangrovibacillus cuniculi]